jgi:hypothetical protein
MCKYNEKYVGHNVDHVRNNRTKFKVDRMIIVWKNTTQNLIPFLDTPLWPRDIAKVIKYGIIG